MNTVVPVTAPYTRLGFSRKARLLLILLAVAALTVVVVPAVAAAILTLPQRGFGLETPAAWQLPFEDLTFPARGGDATIAAWHIPRPGSRRTILMVHGKDGSRNQEFRGSFLELAASLHARGFSILMIDMRGHGHSSASHFTFGLKERRDVLGALDWWRARVPGGGQLGVLGVSMGAGSSIGAAAEDPGIAAVVADCSYADVMPIVEQEWEKVSGLPQFLLPIARMMSSAVIGIDITRARPVDEIGLIAPRNTLIVHGDADTLIPVIHGRQLKAAAPSAEYWEVPGAGHAASYRTQPRAYLERVASFFERNL